MTVIERSYTIQLWCLWALPDSGHELLLLNPDKVTDDCLK